MRLFTPKERVGLAILISLIAIIAIAIWGRGESDISATIEELSSREKEIFEAQTFDPNTVSYQELMNFGITRLEALSIIRYREAGKVYRFKEDILSCSAVSDSIYNIMEPYITIGEEFKYKPKYQSNYSNSTYNSNSTESKSRESATKTKSKQTPLPLAPFRVDSVTAKYLVATSLLTPRQAEVFIAYRDSYAIKNFEDLSRCYVVSDSIASLIKPYAIYPEPTPIDINTADSATLRSVDGIGAKSVVAILEYRKKLGGFVSLEQLSELKEVTESNYEKIIQQIICNNYDISKIDINFASANKISEHPYISSRALRRLLKIRELKGGWSTVEEMIQDDIFTQEEATALRPYLEFTVPNTK